MEESNFWISLGSIIIMGSLVYYTRILFKSSQDQSEVLRKQIQAVNGLTGAIASLLSRRESVMEDEFTERFATEQGKYQRRIRRD